MLCFRVICGIDPEGERPVEVLLRAHHEDDVIEEETRPDGVFLTKKGEPMISVITPLYSKEKFIASTIESVMGQTVADWEMIIVDDGSKDSSLSIARRYADNDPRIRLVAVSENQGAAVARNKGLSRAKGRYIAFLDGDDLWEPCKLERQLEFMERGGWGFTYTNYGLIDHEGKIIKKGFRMPLEFNYEDLLKNTAIGCSTVMIDRQRMGDFRMPLKRAGQDTATWLMLLRQGGSAHGIDELLGWYRKLPGSVSSNKLKALARTWETYRTFEGLSVSRAIRSYLPYVFNAIKRRY